MRGTPHNENDSDSDTSSTSTVPYENEDCETDDDAEVLYQPTTRSGRIIRQRMPTDYSDLVGESNYFH